MLASYFKLVRSNRNFRSLWLAQIVSEAGDWFYSLAIYTLLLQITGQATSIAVALVFQVLPQTFAGPAAGLINDRLSRKQVMIAADLARAGIVACMLFVRGGRDIPLLYFLLLLETVMAAFFEPARNALLPNAVSEGDILTANTLSASTWSFILAVGATAGGIVGALFGRQTVFILNALSFLVSAFLISRIRVVEPHREGAAPFRLRELLGFSSTRDGIVYIRANRKLSLALFLKISTGVLAAGWVLFPILASRVFVAPRLSLEKNTMLVTSLLAGARGIGALTGPLVCSGWAGNNQIRMTRLILLGLASAAAGYAALANAPSLGWACLCIFAAQAGGATVWVNSTTLLHLNSSDHYRGRVFAADVGIAMCAVAISGSLAGAAIDHGAPVRSVAFCIGIAELVLTLTWALLLPLWPRE